MDRPVMSEEVAAGGRLPDLTLPSTPNGAAVRLVRRGRLASIVLLLHGSECADCTRYLESLLERRDDLREWDGRLLPVIRDHAGAVAELSRRLPEHPLLVDPAGSASARLGMSEAAVVIADQWGEIFLVHKAGGSHDFPAPDEVVEWARFLAIQCPECQGEAR